MSLAPIIFTSLRVAVYIHMLKPFQVRLPHFYDISVVLSRVEFLLDSWIIIVMHVNHCFNFGDVKILKIQNYLWSSINIWWSLPVQPNLCIEIMFLAKGFPLAIWIEHWLTMECLTIKSKKKIIHDIQPHSGPFCSLKVWMQGTFLAKRENGFQGRMILCCSMPIFFFYLFSFSEVKAFLGHLCKKQNWTQDIGNHVLQFYVSGINTLHRKNVPPHQAMETETIF